MKLKFYEKSASKKTNRTWVVKNGYSFETAKYNILEAIN